MAWQVQHYSIFESWVNAWTNINPDGSETPATYNSKEEAEEEFRAFLADCKNAVEAGDAIYEEDPSQYRIVEISTL